MKKTRREATGKVNSAAMGHSTEPSHASLAEHRTAQVAWDDYWFTPQSAAGLVRVQQLVCGVSALWFLSQLRSVDFWWNETGLNAISLSGQLDSFSEGDFLSRFRLTPLWSTESSTIIVLWSLFGIVLSIMSALSIGGRISRTVLMICILFLAQRMSWANGLVEPYLVAMTGYLAIARMSPGDDWSQRFATRLIQVHTWLLLAAALASQLAFEPWWQGESAWWLAASERSTILSTNWFEGRLLLVNFITHSVTLSTTVAIACLWPCTNRASISRRRWGMATGLFVAAAYALIADQILYGTLLFAGILAWNYYQPKDVGDLAS